MLQAVDPPHLAPYASLPRESRGRAVPEPDSPSRTVHQRDRDRIIHSAAFRGMKHKTQVFVYHEGDHFRTRLTHSLEVAQIARSVSRALGLSEDLAEALALAHDLGHPPFGHAGEEALRRAMAEFGGFDHNEQTFRVLTRLEQRYAEFDGLNLTWETLEGTVKHNGPLLPADTRPSIAAFDRDFGLELDRYPGLEAQVASLSDDIAYNNHDMDDGLRAGLFALDDVAELALVGPALRQVRERYPGLDPERAIHETIRRVIDRMVGDLLAETTRRLGDASPRHAADIRSFGQPLAAFSDEMRRHDRELKNFLFERMYRHFRVNRMASRAQRTVGQLFAFFMEEPQCLPTRWQASCAPVEERARRVADYIAGMTDRAAQDEYQKVLAP